MKLRWLAVVSAAFVMTFGSGAALAQDKQAQADAVRIKLEARHQALQKVLASIDATLAQSNQIFEIRERYDHGKLGLGVASREQVDLVKLHSLQEEAGKAIANVLSPAQFQKLRSSGGIPVLLGEDKDGSPWDFLRKLDLTMPQRIQLKKIMAQANKSMDAIEKDGSLSADQAKAKLGAAHETAISQLEEILTLAQQLQLHKLLAEHANSHAIKP